MVYAIFTPFDALEWVYFMYVSHTKKKVDSAYTEENVVVLMIQESILKYLPRFLKMSKISEMKLNMKMVQNSTHILFCI